MPNVDPGKYDIWGKQVSTGYLTKGESMNESIAKIASENDLNPAQIKRVCEKSNMLTYQSLFAADRKKALDFDIADNEKVAKSLETATVSKPTSMDYLSAPNFKKTASKTEVNTAFGVKSISNGPEIQERMKIADKFAKKLDAAKAEVNRRMAENDLNKKASIERIHYIVKQMCLNGNDFRKVATAAYSQMKKEGQERFKSILGDLHKSLKSNGVFGIQGKLAQDDSADIISQAIEACQAVQNEDGSLSIINNRHPLIQEVSTLGDALVSEDKLRTVTWLLNDTANIVRGKIHDLSTVESRDQYIKDQNHEPPVRQTGVFFTPEHNRKPGQLELSR